MTDALLEAGGFVIFCGLVFGLAFLMERGAAFHRRGLARLARWDGNGSKGGK